MKLKHLFENIEDRHSEINDEIDSLINFFHEQRLDKLIIRDYIESQNRLNQLFDVGHETNDDDQMDGALADLCALAGEMRNIANNL